MGWTDLFKSKPAKAKPDPRLRWFGKLPTYGDYYCSAVDEAWTVEFHDWVLKGFELYLARERATGGGHDMRVPSAAGIIRLPKSDTTVLASVQDFGGDMRGRAFPICFYVGLPSQVWPGPTSERVSAGLRVLSELTALRKYVVRFMNAPGRFEDTFGGREIDLSGLTADARDGSWVEAARSLPLTDWWQVVRAGAAEKELGTWWPLASAWGNSIANNESDDFHPTLRFPFAMALSFETQVAGWLRWLETKMNLEQRRLTVLVGKDPAGEIGRLSVVARELVPEDFLLVTPHAGGLAYVDDVSTLRAPAPQPEAVTVPQDASIVSGAQAVRVPDTWAELVEPTTPI